jgi:hypothetical protein
LVAHKVSNAGLKGLGLFSIFNLLRLKDRTIGPKIDDIGFKGFGIVDIVDKTLEANHILTGSKLQHMIITLSILVDSVKVEPPLVVGIDLLGGVGAEAVDLLGHALIIAPGG